MDKTLLLTVDSVLPILSCQGRWLEGGGSKKYHTDSRGSFLLVPYRHVFQYICLAFIEPQKGFAPNITKPSPSGTSINITAEKASEAHEQLARREQDPILADSIMVSTPRTSDFSPLTPWEPESLATDWKYSAGEDRTQLNNAVAVTSGSTPSPYLYK